MERFRDPTADTSNSHETLKKVRPSWDEYFMRIAHEVATRSTCPRLAVGAVIVRDKRILTTGYNGSPSGMPHCDDVGCLIRIVDGRESCQRTLHAEQNAIIQAAYHGVSVTGASIYCTHQPCLMCVKMIMNAGIEEVHYVGRLPRPPGDGTRHRGRTRHDPVRRPTVQRPDPDLLQRSEDHRAFPARRPVLGTPEGI